MRTEVKTSILVSEVELKLSTPACKTKICYSVGVHRNPVFKFRPEPDPAGTGKKFPPEVPAGTGTNLLSHI